MSRNTGQQPQASPQRTELKLMKQKFPQLRNLGDLWSVLGRTCPKLLPGRARNVRVSVDDVGAECRDP